MELRLIVDNPIYIENSQFALVNLSVCGQTILESGATFVTENVDPLVSIQVTWQRCTNRWIGDRPLSQGIGMSG